MVKKLLYVAFCGFVVGVTSTMILYDKKILRVKKETDDIEIYIMVTFCIYMLFCIVDCLIAVFFEKEK